MAQRAFGTRERQNTSPFVPATREALEASWEAAVSHRGQDGGKLPLVVLMGSKDFAGAQVERWCVWFDKHLSRLSTRQEVLIRELNFSSNRLTSAGLRIILELLKKHNCFVGVLNNYQNHIECGGAIVDFLQWSEGQIRELHLSDNRLDTKAVHDIIVAAAAAVDSRENACYPRSGTIPLWLRMEIMREPSRRH